MLHDTVTQYQKMSRYSEKCNNTHSVYIVTWYRDKIAEEVKVLRRCNKTQYTLLYDTLTQYQKMWNNVTHYLLRLGWGCFVLFVCFLWGWGKEGVVILILTDNVSVFVHGTNCVTGHPWFWTAVSFRDPVTSSKDLGLHQEVGRLGTNWQQV